MVITWYSSLLSPARGWLPTLGALGGVAGHVPHGDHPAVQARQVGVRPEKMDLLQVFG